MEDYQWPVTLHSDIGCDVRIAPKTAPEDLPMGASESAWDVVNRECQVPKDELDLAAKNFQFWKDLLDDHYPAFFDVKTNVPKENFIKILLSHLILTIYHSKGVFHNHCTLLLYYPKHTF